MELKISKSIFERFPKLKLGILVLKGIDNTKIDDKILDKIKIEEEKIRKEM